MSFLLVGCGVRVVVGNGEAQTVRVSAYDAARSMAVGDIIEVVRWVEAKDAWWTGRLLKDGSEGQFPANFTESCREEVDCDCAEQKQNKCCMSNRCCVC